ncbi:hypothetical protein PC110_g3792 [Phytophthora cactorum]|nr:hypothetical protein PC113_g11490 [Phytophthora cactorum]RAW39973.1 hypothetical protein PC110_g3792 [Phytophthora cactorum]
MATTSAGSVGAVSPDASRHLLAKEARLAHARSNRNKALADRQQTEAKLRDLDSATTDLEKQVHRLLEAVAAKRRRIRELKTYFEQRLTRSSDVVTSQGEECGRLQELVDHLQENLQKASKQLKSVTCQRDHAAVEKIDPPSCSNHPYLVQRPEWLFPRRGPTPPTLEWRDDLIDEDRVRLLEDAAPWEVLTTPVDPLTFEDGGWFAHVVRVYSTYEDEHHRANWDSTHAFPICIAKRRQSRYLSGFYTNHKQRRSRTEARWIGFLQLVFEGMRRGLCDLDILLDPFFLHFPRSGEAGVWYPGLEAGTKPADLLGALEIFDNADRWHNHYRGEPTMHPVLRTARLTGTFMSSTA